MKNSTILLVLLGTLCSLSSATAGVWLEGESVAAVHPPVDGAVGVKNPASGGKCLAGVTLRLEGNSVSYRVMIPDEIADAVMTFRYARLHVMDWEPAPILIRLEGDGQEREFVETFGQTGGWGANGPAEWGLKHVSVGTLLPGDYTLTLMAAAPHCNLNLDGILISGSSQVFLDGEMNDLDRVSLSGDGYWGIGLRTKAVDQEAFPDLFIQAGLWDEAPGAFDVSLSSGAENTVPLVNRKVILTAEDDGRWRQSVPGDLFSGIADGAYDLVVRREVEGKSLTIPVVAMGELYKKAEERAATYAAYEQTLKTEKPRMHDRFGADFVYAVEYLENTLILLRTRGGEASGPEDARKRALAYMERSKNRTAEDFAHDMQAILMQFDETIRRIELGDTRPYAGRTGDFRRAYVSEQSGLLKPYRLFVPEGFWSARENKLLLTLHGGGGDENYFPENDDGRFAETANRLGYMFAAPRALSRYRDGEELDLKQLVELLQKEYPRLSPDRTYCTGVSMGGFGTFHLATHFPGLFRAVACVSSGGGRNLPDEASLRQADLSNLEQTPILILHGEVDSVVPVEQATSLAHELKRRGYVHDIEIFPGHGHAYYGDIYLNRTNQFFESLKK